MGQTVSASPPSDYDLYQPRPEVFSLVRLEVVGLVDASLPDGSNEQLVLSITPSPSSGSLDIRPGPGEPGRRRRNGDGGQVAFVCDPDAGPVSRERTLLRVPNAADGLEFRFGFRMARGDEAVPGLSFVTAESRTGMEKVLRLERQIDPNLSNRPNVVVIGPAGGGLKSTERSFDWRFVAPSSSDRFDGTGHRLFCAFVAFDARKNDFDVLASFCLLVDRGPRPPSTPSVIAEHASAAWTAPGPSSSVGGDGRPAGHALKSVTSPNLASDAYPSSTPTAPLTPSAYDLDAGDFDDGPLFRATLSGLEKRCATLRKSIKGLVRGLEAVRDTLVDLEGNELKLDEAFAFVDEASPAAYRPLKEAYLQEARLYLFALAKERTQRLEFAALEPLKRMAGRLKEVETRKKLFEAESRAYYDHVHKYLAVKTDEGLAKETKADERFAAAKNRFALARVSYHHALYDCAVFQEVETLYALCQFASTQHDLYTLGTDSGRALARMGATLSQLQDELVRSKAECELRRAEFEEHRRALETKVAMSEAGPDLARMSIDVSSSSRSPPPASSTGSTGPPSKSQEIGDRLRDLATSLGMRREAASAGEAGGGGAGGGEGGRRHWRNKPSLGKLPPSSSSAAVASAVPLSPSSAFPPKINPPPVPADASAARKKEGFLYAASRASSHQASASEGGRTWHRYWTVLAGGMLSEYTGWSDGLELHGTPIDLRFASAREARSAERRFCFEVLTPSIKRVYQATSDADVKDWVRAITASIESLLNGTSTVRNIDVARMKSGSSPLLSLSEGGSRAESTASLTNESDSPGMSFAARLIRRRPSAKRRSVGAVRVPGATKPDPKPGRTSLGRLPEGSRSLGSLGTSLGGVGTRRSVSDNAATTPGGEAGSGSSAAEGDTSDEVDDFDRAIAHAVNSLAGSQPRNRHSMPVTSPSSTSAESKARNAVEIESLVRLPGNSACAECSEAGPRWASWSLGVFVCIRCSGIHRSLGTHISKVRSVDLDDWSDEQILPMRTIGNTRSKAIWEARLPRGYLVTDENVGAFIRKKYCDGVWRAPPAPPDPSTADHFDEANDVVTPTFPRSEEWGRPRFRSADASGLSGSSSSNLTAQTVQRGQHVRAQSYAGAVHHYGKAI